MRLPIYVLLALLASTGAQGQVLEGAGVICGSELAAKTVSDDLRSPDPQFTDETEALFVDGVCHYHEHFGVIVTGIVREQPYSILTVESVNGKLHAFLVIGDE